MVGIIFFPIALFCVWGKDLRHCGLFALGLALLFVVVVTSVSIRMGLFGSLLVAFAGLLFCRLTSLPFFGRSHHAPV